ncbi:helix-turn-helix domain-containing protein [Alkalibacterium olivapovliticus]|uniref:Uncharacterized protein YpbB n=1 Tax=Alkalibacterium olivapovliticus TaxID=99907 RepID=A0A2T0W0R8_9LACT|nr:helix-turn-helix domain-containing protein [Alkalibacterium olivapovliticus]PRY78422.1 uncharacterized protein YpbB [Alkalibacterium olivapovliticus]
MTNDFFLDYIIFLFTQQTRVTPKQLALIASGKRTPSNLFTAEKNELQGLFNSPIPYTESEWRQYLKRLSETGNLIEDGDFFLISASGLKKKKEVKHRYPFLNDIPSLAHSQTRKEFWSWFIFVSQIISELSYTNSRYIPSISDYFRQRAIKKWLADQVADRHNLVGKWAEELTVFLTALPERYRHFLLDQLTGHGSEGLTERQLCQKYEMDPIEIGISLNHLMQELYEKRDAFPLFDSLWIEVHLFCHEGLSESAWKSIQLLNRDYTIDQVASMRKLKENTIKEHILENVLVNPCNPIQQYIPESIYIYLKESFKENENLTYQDVKIQSQTVEFFWFRLVEIERLRVKRCQ